MKRINSIFCGVLMISNLAFPQIRLNIEIVEIRNNTGNVILQLFNEKEEVITFEIKTIQDNKCSISFKI